MRAARLENSDRLQRVLQLLANRARNGIAGGWVPTRRIIRLAHVCAVNSIISELRANGCVIDCELRIIGGRKRYFYRLERAPEGWDG